MNLSISLPAVFCSDNQESETYIFVLLQVSPSFLFSLITYIKDSLSLLINHLPLSDTDLSSPKCHGLADGEAGQPGHRGHEAAQDPLRPGGGETLRPHAGRSIYNLYELVHAVHRYILMEINHGQF